MWFSCLRVGLRTVGLGLEREMLLGFVRSLMPIFTEKSDLIRGNMDRVEIQVCIL